MLSLLLLLVDPRKRLKETLHQRLRASAKKDKVKVGRAAFHRHGLVLLLLLQQVFHLLRQGATTTPLPPSRPGISGDSLAQDLGLWATAEAHPVPAAGAGKVAVAVEGGGVSKDEEVKRQVDGGQGSRKKERGGGL